MKRASMLLVVVAIALAVAACGGSQESGSKAAGNGDGTTQEVIMADYSFDPADLTFNQGEKVTLNLKNEGSTAHDFSIDALEISTGPVAVGDTVTVEIPTDKPGEYEVYCAIPGHKELGMVGTLTIK